MTFEHVQLVNFSSYE